MQRVVLHAGTDISPPGHPPCITDTVNIPLPWCSGVFLHIMLAKCCQYLHTTRVHQHLIFKSPHVVKLSYLMILCYRFSSLLSCGNSIISPILNYEVCFSFNFSFKMADRQADRQAQNFLVVITTSKVLM